MRKKFAEIYAQTGNRTYAATKAGYADPAATGSVLAKDPQIIELTRAEQQRFAREEAGSHAIRILLEVGTDPKQPGGVRVSAAKVLHAMSGIGASDETDGKDPSEMSGDELHLALARMERQRMAIEKALSDQAKPIVEAKPLDEPSADVFG